MKAEKEPLYKSTIIPSENTPATIEADQTLLAFQRLASNNNSASFRNNINRISKLPKSLTSTMPTFDGKSEKFELFDDLFQTSLKIYNQPTEEDRINYFHSLMRGDALQTFKNINGPTINLGEKLGEFGRKSGSFPKEICKTPIVSDSETQIPETCLQPSKSIVGRFS